MTGFAKNMRMTVAAPAKINLFLEITGKALRDKGE